MFVEAFYDELSKSAGLGKSTLKGGAIGAGVGGAYGALKEVVRESRKDKKDRRYGRAALEGFLNAAPKGGAVGALAGGGYHASKEVGKEFREGSAEYKRTARKLNDVLDEAHRGAKPAADVAQAAGKLVNAPRRIIRRGRIGAKRAWRGMKKAFGQGASHSAPQAKPKRDVFIRRPSFVKNPGKTG